MRAPVQATQAGSRQRDRRRSDARARPATLNACLRTRGKSESERGPDREPALEAEVHVGIEAETERRDEPDLVPARVHVGTEGVAVHRQRRCAAELAEGLGPRGASAEEQSARQPCCEGVAFHVRPPCLKGAEGERPCSTRRERRKSGRPASSAIVEASSSRRRPPGASLCPAWSTCCSCSRCRPPASRKCGATSHRSAPSNAATSFISAPPSSSTTIPTST